MQSRQWRITLQPTWHDKVLLNKLESFIRHLLWKVCFTHNVLTQISLTLVFLYPPLAPITFALNVNCPVRRARPTSSRKLEKIPSLHAYLSLVNFLFVVVLWFSTIETSANVEKSNYVQPKCTLIIPITYDTIFWIAVYNQPTYQLDRSSANQLRKKYF